MATATPGKATLPPPSLPPHKKPTTGADFSKESSKKRKRKKRKQMSTAKSKRLRYDSDSSSSKSYATDRVRVRGRRKGAGSRRKKKKKRERVRHRRRSSVSRDKSSRRKMDGSENARRKKKGSIRGFSEGSELGYSSSSEGYSRRKRRRSRSCSTCSRSSSSSPERFDKKGKSRRRERNFDAKKPRVIRKKDKKNGRHASYRSPSCSTCSSRSTSNGSSSSRSRSRERFAERTRLEEVAGGCSYGDYDERVEITHDCEDFPSSRSNDSWDGNDKRDKRISPVEIEENARESGGGARWDPHYHWDHGGIMEEEGTYLHGDVMHNNGNDEVDNELQSARGPSARLKSVVIVPAPDAEPVTDDLESMLRKKALENLKKFRGYAKPPSHQKDEPLQSDSCGPSGPSLELESGHRQKSEGSTMPPKHILTRLAEEKSEVQDRSFEVKNEDKSSNKPCSEMADLLRCRDRKNQDEVANVVYSSQRPQLTTPQSVATSTSVLNRGQDCPNQYQGEQKKQCGNLLSQVPGVHNVYDSENATKPVSHATETIKTHRSISGLSAVPDDNAQGSTETDKTQGSTSRTDTELQMKTMTVMRGGEMVQVNYKVYIPKKTPALARRQLKR